MPFWVAGIVPMTGPAWGGGQVVGAADDEGSDDDGGGEEEERRLAFVGLTRARESV